MYTVKVIQTNTNTLVDEEKFKKPIPAVVDFDNKLTKFGIKTWHNCSPNHMVGISDSGMMVLLIED